MSEAQPELPDALLQAAAQAVEQQAREAAKLADDERRAELDTMLPRFEGGNGFDGDIALIFDDGAELHAHTTILSQWSVILSQAFELQHCRRFEMKGCSSHAWRAILSNMYPVDIDMDAFDLDFWVCVLQETDKYDIPVIKKRVCSYVVRKMSSEKMETTLKMSRLAASLNMRDMMCECQKRLQDYIIPSDSGVKSEYFTTEMWDELENSISEFPGDILGKLFRRVAQELTKANLLLRCEIRDSQNAIAEAGCFISNRSSRLCSKRTKQPVQL